MEMDIYNWSAVYTEIVMIVFAGLLLLGRALISDKYSKWLYAFGIFAIVLAVIVEVFSGSNPEMPSWGGTMIEFKAFGFFMLACVLLTALMGINYFNKSVGSGNEYLAILLVAGAGLMIFVRSMDLVLAFVALETTTVCLYGMSAWARKFVPSLEAGVKYLIISGVSGAFFLLGIAFIYGASFEAKEELLNIANFTYGLTNAKFLIGLTLVFSALFFKIALCPFQFWAPDVYEGVPMPTTAFFSVASKAAAVVFLAKIFMFTDFEVYPELKENLAFAISTLAIITMIVANTAGLTQIKIKRLMAFSGISNAGYLMIPTLAILVDRQATSLALMIIFVYLSAYLLSNYAVFFVANQFGPENDSKQTIANYRGLLSKDKTLGSSLIIGLASLAGIPPTAGFFAKLAVLWFAYMMDMYYLMGFMIFASVISIYYYFAWIRAGVSKEDENEKIEVKSAGVLTPTICFISFLTVFFSVILMAMDL